MPVAVEEVGHLVIGSGPSAAAACQALVDLGRSCTVVDIGAQLERPRAAVVQRLGSLPPGRWASDDARFVAGDMKPSLRGVAVKTVFGSLYPYYDAKAAHALLDPRGSALGTSQSLGGFTAVWGSAALPFAREDMTGWPVEVDLEPFYAAVQRVVPVTGGSDGLLGPFPSRGPTVAPIPPTAEMRALHDDLTRGEERLRSQHMVHGLGRVAVGRPGVDLEKNSCNGCGFCLNGCPYGLIFNAADVVTEHAARGRVQYVGGVEVDRLEPRPGGVLVHAVDRRSGEPRLFFAGKVFLGSGVVGTARIVAASLALDRLDLDVKDTCYFLVPFLRFRGARGYREGGFRLTQGFLQFEPGTVSDRRVNLQLYGYNDLFDALLDRLLRRLVGGWRLPRDLLLSRLLLFQGYLHSDESPALKLSLERTGDGRYRATTNAVPNPRSRRIIRRVLRKLLREAATLRGVPLLPLVKIEAPGRGYHFGGSFPMRSHPREWFETDSLGQLAGLPGVHVVDSSLFPSIPPTTMVLSTMANAYRIASAAGI
jgi:choline dehydrogenase-like flavoprotein